MENRLLLLFLLVSVVNVLYANKLYTNSMLIGHLHNQIHEDTVPEFKEFNAKIQKLFQSQHSDQRESIIKDVQAFGERLVKNLENKLRDNKELTSAEQKTIKEVIYIIKEKLKKFVKNTSLK